MNNTFVIRRHFSERPIQEMANNVPFKLIQTILLPSYPSTQTEISTRPTTGSQSVLRSYRSSVFHFARYFPALRTIYVIDDCATGESPGAVISRRTLQSLSAQYAWRRRILSTAKARITDLAYRGSYEFKVSAKFPRHTEREGEEQVWRCATMVYCREVKDDANDQ